MFEAVAFALWLQQAAPVAPAAVIAELRTLEERLASAYARHDCDGWASMLADEWSVTHLAGNVVTKAQAVEQCRTSPPFTSRYDDLSFRTYGDTAIVTGRTTATTTGPSAQTVVLRFTDVFVRRDGRWRVVASHATRVPD